MIGQAYFRKMRASVILWKEAHRFCWRYKHAWLFPLGILVCYACLFGVSIGLVFLLTHHQLHTLRIAAWVQHYGVHWYYFLFLLAYYGCCNLIFSFFGIGLTSYIGHAFQETVQLSYWQTLKKTAGYWRYLLSAMLIGNPIVFTLRVADFWSENSGRLVGQVFGCAKKMARYIFLPTATFENASMFKIFRRASQLWDDRGEKALELHFGWIYGTVLLFILIVFVAMMLSIHSLHTRIIISIVTACVFASIYMTNVLVNAVFQTGIYFYLKGEKYPPEALFLPQLDLILQQDFE